MAASENNKFIQLNQKSLSSASPLLRVSAFAAVGLINVQTVIAQTEASALEIAIPQPTTESTVAPPPAAPTVAPPAVTPAPTVIVPEVVEPAAPSNIVPTNIETTVSGPDTVDYGAVFIEPTEAAGSASVESLLEGIEPDNNTPPPVEVISPADYGTAQVDTTDYSVGATMPEVIISERSSGCEFALEVGSQVANAACNQVDRLADALSGLAPTQPGGIVAPANIPSINIPGAQVVGLTTAASREYYKQATQAVVKLQQGQTFIFPLSMPASLTSLFGWRTHPIFGDRRFHAGTDVGAPLGTPVVATQSGQVVLSDSAGGYGLMVVLHHDNGTLESRYAHLSRLMVQAGEWVEQGDVIGLVGSTGNSTGPHLHFELRQLTDNGWVVLNPDSLLRQTLGTLVQVLGNSLTALTGNGSLDVAAAAKPTKTAVSLDALPFRPAQPHAN